MRSMTVITALVASAAVSGCLGRGPDAPEVSRSVPVSEIAALPARAPVLDPEMQDGSTSALIAGLLARRSVLQPGPLSDVAQAVLEANTRAAEAELRAAVLRSEAKAANWLPRLGPSVNLTSLGSIVTSLVLNQAILDHGARAAEREFAAADVEVAAVALAQDSNERVHQALGLYLAAGAAEARAASIEAALDRMDRYVWMMEERVAAGVTDRADLQSVVLRRDQLLADLAADREAASVAMAELQAMAARPLDGLAGLSGLVDSDADTAPLTVLRAMAEGRRAAAEARVLRAGYLPGISVGGDLGGGGLGLTLGAPNGLGMGQGSAMQAAVAEAAAVEARVGQEAEAAAREIASLDGRLTALIRQAAEARVLAAQAAETYALHAEQQAAGQRSVPETFGALETAVRAERTAAGLEHDIVAARVAIAARLGLLVDGERM